MKYNTHMYCAGFRSDLYRF